MIPIQRLNHAVLYVSDLERSVGFYTRVFGFTIVAREGRMAFLRAPGSDNHHDLGLLSVGKGAKAPEFPYTGLYHLAWQLPSIKDLEKALHVLVAEKAYTGASDHGATKSLYGKDPDGNEFELMVLLPRGEWGAYEHEAPIQPLDLAKELDRERRR